MPALIFNSRKVMPEKPKFYLWPKKMKMHFLPPVKITPTDTVESVKENLFAIMSAYYAANEEGVGYRV